MSKYIRTKNNIYEIEENIMLTSMPPQYQRVDGKGIPQTEVIKQGDSIGELCDEFVAWTNGCGNPVVIAQTQKDYYTMASVITIGINSGLDCWLKAGIWTEKGLVYVAKLNNQCKLELLGGEDD